MEENYTYTAEEQQMIDAATKKWSWGGFCFGWIWSVFNGIYWPLVLIPAALLDVIFDNTAVSVLTGIIELGIAIYLGINGKAMAWKSKQWESLEQFTRVQHNWAMAALWVVLGCVGLVVLLLMFVGAAIFM